MGLLQWLRGSKKRAGGSWGSKVRGLPGMSARTYESAATSRINKKHWTNANGSDADGVITPALAVLRNRSRHEVRNNGYAEGLVETYACDVVGPDGPKLQVQSSSDAWNKSVEDGFNQWARTADVGERMELQDILRLLVRGFFEAGEGLVQHVVTDRRSGPVRRRLLVIEADRLSSPFGVDTAEVRNGVRIERSTGRPLSYYVLKDHPGALNYTGTVAEYDEVPARDIMHIYKMLRPGQTRGVPWLAPVLDIFGQLRDLTMHTLLAAEYAAALAVLIYTDHDDTEFDNCGDELDVMDIEPGTMSMLPHGWKASQIKPEQPAENYTDFKKELLKEVGRVVGMPYLVIGNDASNHNYSSARMDNQSYWSGVRFVQSFLARHFATPNVELWVQEAYLAGSIKSPPPGWKTSWTWNQATHVDPAKEEAAAVLRLANGTSTWKDECKAKGRDWEEVFAQLKREIDTANDLGLELDFTALVLKAASIIGKDNQGDDKDDEGNDK